MSHLMTKPTMWLCAQRRLRSAWASAQSDQSSLSAWRTVGSLATRWAHSEGSDQIGRMPRLIWVFVGRIATLLVLSWGGSYRNASLNGRFIVVSDPNTWAATWENISSEVSDQVRLKLACSGTETSYSLEISAIESRDIILSMQRKTKALISLRGCTGWSAPLLFAYDIRHVFSWPGSNVFMSKIWSIVPKQNFSYVWQ